MIQNKMRRGKPARWVASLLQRSGDLVAIGGGMLGLALIVAVVLVGLHERETSVRSVSPSQSSEGGASSYR